MTCVIVLHLDVLINKSDHHIVVMALITVDFVCQLDPTFKGQCALVSNNVRKFTILSAVSKFKS